MNTLVRRATATIVLVLSILGIELLFPCYSAVFPWGQEVEAQEPAPVNLAAAENGGRIAFASSEADEYPASNLLDGDKLDYGEWIALSLDFPLYVVVDLAGQAPHVIDHVVLNPWNSEWRLAWIKDFEIYASATSSRPEEMDLIGAFTLEHYGVDQLFSFDAVEAKYVALAVQSHYGNPEGVSLTEFEVYAAPDDTTPVGPAVELKPDNLVAAANGGQIVAVSSEDPNGHWPAARLIDSSSDTPTGWSSAETDTRPFVVFGFPEGQSWTVNRVALSPYSHGYEADWIQDFELRGSETETDVERMTSLGAFTLEQTGELQTFIFAPTQLRYIALVALTNHGGSAFALNEFEVYAITARKPQPISEKHVAQAAGTAPLVSTVAPITPAPLRDVRATPTPPAIETVQPAPVSIENIDVDLEYSALVPVIYHLYGSYFQSLVLMTFTNKNPFPVTLRVETVVPSYTETDVKTFILAPGEVYTVEQNPSVMPAAWELLRENRDATLHLTIEYLAGDRRNLIYEETYPLLIYARNNFPWNIPGYHNGTVFLATMVTPNDPRVDALLRVAADYSPNGIITFGYGDDLDSDHGVWNRMKAIYDAIASYGVIYVAAGVDFVPIQEQEHGFTMQRLKLPGEVLDGRSGMCVETSTLFASAMEAILLRPILITVPGHVYVTVPISEDSDTYYFLETTLVGRATFEEAIQVASQDWTESTRAVMEADQLDDYFWLDVAEARVEGILPTPLR